MTSLPALHKRFRYIKCPITEKFLPLDVIDEEVTPQSVEQTLRDSAKERSPPRLFKLWSRNPQIPDPRLVVERAKKIFAILAIIGEPLEIESLLDEGISDEDLPLKRHGDDDNDNVLISRDRNRRFQSFASWKDDRRVAEFLEKQWVVLAPVIDRTGKHVELDSLCALPFMAVDELGNGSTNVVYKAEVHPTHQKGLHLQDGKAQVAAKEMRTVGAFRQEKENLDKIVHIRHEHLIQHLATYERGRVYYVIFPWANGGNLAEFWDDQDSCNRDRALLMWSLRQMLGIAGAIEALHGVNCRHGDLKPENILHFKPHENDRGTLVVADVGVSRVHKQMTGLRSEGTTTRATTPAYEAPESVEKGTPRARRYDMWSLGCILLEWVIWLLEDSKAIEKFHSSRDKPFFEFYRHRGTRQEVHPVVLGTMDAIRQDFRVKDGTALDALVALISKHLLLVDPESRGTAEMVYQRIGAIVKKAEQDSEYIFNEVDTAPDKLRFVPRAARKDSFAFDSSADVIFEEPSEI